MAYTITFNSLITNLVINMIIFFNHLTALQHFFFSNPNPVFFVPQHKKSTVDKKEIENLKIKLPQC